MGTHTLVKPPREALLAFYKKKDNLKFGDLKRIRYLRVPSVY